MKNGKYKLLVVDDNPTHIDCVLKYIDWHSLGVGEYQTAANGVEGYEKFLAFGADIVVTDVSMPFMDGLAMQSRIVGRQEGVEFIFMSCHDEFEYIKQAMDKNAIRYILKPFMPEELLSAAQKAVANLERTEAAIKSEALIEDSVSILRENTMYKLFHSLAANESTLSDVSYESISERFNAQELGFLPFELKDEVAALLNDVAQDCAEDTIETFIRRHIADDETDTDRIKNISFFVTVALQSELINRGHSLTDLFSDVNKVWLKFGKAEANMNWRQWLKNILIYTIQLITSESDRYSKIVVKINEFIDDNFAKIHSAEQIAEALFISSGYAKNIYAKYMGKTIQDKLTQVRMMEAMRLLSESDKKIEDIAELVGYKSKAHFMKTFKKYTGLTSKEYRKQ